MKPKIAISHKEYLIHQKNAFFRYLTKPDYPIDIHSGRTITEFVALADKCRSIGLSVIPYHQIRKCLESGENVLKFGKTDINTDILELSRYPNIKSEWNLNNLEKVLDWYHYVQSERRIWNLFLDRKEDLYLLRQLFSQYGSLFIKTKMKGFSGTYKSFERFLKNLPYFSLLAEESKDILVSEVMELKSIETEHFPNKQIQTDEWRHYIYQDKLITSSHAFDCDERRTDNSGYRNHVRKARQMMEIFSHSHFATLMF